MLAARRTLHMRTLQCLPERVSSGIRRRMVMTESIEPPPLSTVSERPCEVVLAQDAGLYPTCWLKPFSQILPQERGLHFCSVSIDSRNLQEGLDILEQDLAPLPNIVLIARGPLVSLVAQYYLESLPLAGLVMVDPILIHHVDALQKIGSSFEQDSVQHEFVGGILSGMETRPLKLEPGAVPVLVFQSMEDSTFCEAAKDVALRHGDPDGAFGEVPVHAISTDDKDALLAIDVITEWIDDSVL